ncbi:MULTISPECIES: hypothetical protein [Propionimicrobium]|uniref:hypothetical protein n=1 Tax=Propionimicrobium TaxID=203133 RepID=UPI0012DCABC6|nr:MULTISPECIES: hypothetical protein [Propionimicrobium]
MNRVNKVASGFLASLVMLSLCACGPANKGPETTCGDYLKMSSSKQKKTIETIFKEKNRSPEKDEVSKVAGMVVSGCSFVDEERTLDYFFK